MFSIRLPGKSIDLTNFIFTNIDTNRWRTNSKNFIDLEERPTEFDDTRKVLQEIRSSKSITSLSNIIY